MDNNIVPVDVDGFPRGSATRLYEQWLLLAARSGHVLTFDEWLDTRPVKAGRAVLFRQGSKVFELQHGAVYQARTPSGARQFRCLLDGDYPWASFLNPVAGVCYPWVTFPRVLSTVELFSLRKIRERW